MAPPVASPPLYALAQERSLPPLQHMDVLTIDWIERESALGLAASPPAICPRLTGADIALLEALLPEDTWFLNPDTAGGLHGRRHLFRVMVNTVWVCALVGAPARGLVLAASLHDIRRLDDQADPGHGARASTFFDTLQEHWHLDPSEARMVAAAIAYHEVKPSAIPAEVLAEFGTAISLIKAADALDRYRQPYAKWWPNPALFTVPAALALLRPCRALTLASERAALAGAADWPSVRDAALAIAQGGMVDAA